MSQLITREYRGNTFVFREDGYINMTKTAKEFGKRIDDFLVNKATTEYMEALANTGNVRDLLKTKRGHNGGTWGHPKLAVFFARWLDVKFAVFCDMVIDDILNKKAELVITKPEESAEDIDALAKTVPDTELIEAKAGRYGGTWAPPPSWPCSSRAGEMG